jgi:imidazolonepropionase-like amidohydrolase
MWSPANCWPTALSSSMALVSPVWSMKYAPHGLGARQFAYQVRCGQSPLGAIQSATIHAAELIRWNDRVGRIAPGYLADIIAVNGNPLQDIRLLENAVFVMKDGAVHHAATGWDGGPPTP